MGKKEETKERILDAAIDIIRKSNGDVDKVTIRGVAEKANVAVGLINHYFMSKDELIESAVSKIIDQVVVGFKPEIEKKSKRERVSISLSRVYGFFLTHPSISRISMLADLKNPRENDNTSKSLASFLTIFGDKPSEEDKRTVLLLIDFLQELFLRKEDISKRFNVNLDEINEASRFIDEFVAMLIKD